MTLLFSNDFKIPLPDLRSNGLAHGPQNSQMFHLRLNMVITRTLE